jgi:transcriptional regulator with XRE-family HTH domain
MSSSENTGLLIRKAIEEAGLTPPEVAALCGTTRQAVHGWIKTGRIAKHRLLRLAEVTNRAPSYFLGDAVSELSDPLEAQLLKIWRALPSDSRHALLTEAHRAYQRAYSRAPEVVPTKFVQR